MNKQRMLKLADFLETLPTKKFDFSMIRDHDKDVQYIPPAKCGAVGCAIGWMPTVFPRLCGDWVASKTKNGYTVRDGVWFDDAAEVLDIDYSDCTALFTPGGEVYGLRNLGENTTPKAVARRIRQFVEKYPTSKFTG